MTKSELREMVERFVSVELPSESERSVSDYLRKYPESTRWHQTADYHAAAALERMSAAPARMSVEQTATHCRCLLDHLHDYWHADQQWQPETARALWLESMRRFPAPVVAALLADPCC